MSAFLQARDDGANRRAVDQFLLVLLAQHGQAGHHGQDGVQVAERVVLVELPDQGPWFVQADE